MKTDIQIAQEAVMKPITEIAAELDITMDDLELYGKYKAKISDEYMNKIADRKAIKQKITINPVWTLFSNSFVLDKDFPKR